MAGTAVGATGDEEPGTAWQPGLRSDIPRALRPLITLFRPEHASASHAEAAELAELCGLGELELVALRPERLVVHELLVRVTADLSVPDGPGYGTLGLNLRSMVATIHERHVLPELPGIVAAFDVELAAASAHALRELGEAVADPAPDAARTTPAPTPRSWLARWFGGATAAAVASSEASPVSPTDPTAALARWERTRHDAASPAERACLDALVTIVGAMLAHRGRLVVDAAVIARLVAARVGNTYGAVRVAELVAPIFERAVDVEGYRRLPVQAAPVVMNVKGASASGKSTIRPRQRELAERLGIPWEDFALISPDYWRKHLLDYASLGPDHKYGAMLTGGELEMIDRKLDRHMAAKAAAGRMSHLLIDRFRFDSFALDRGRTADSRLLSRFGHRVFLFFMITPPAETVERAWKRGSTTGRYKAVDDLLYHNVEAFMGMPALFLSWVRAADLEVHFEFLDNGVAEGEVPRTAAFGWNDSMTILDVERMLDIDRYRKVNVDARSSGAVLDAAGQGVADNMDFLRRCAEGVASLTFARTGEPDGAGRLDHTAGEPVTARPYAHLRGGRLVWWDDAWLGDLPADAPVRTVLAAFGHGGSPCPPDRTPPPMDAAHERGFTLGRWP